MPKLKVVKGLRLVPGTEAFKKLPVDKAGLVGSLGGAVYIEGDVCEPSAVEAKVLMLLFPEHFEEAK